MANRYFTQFFYSFFKKPTLIAGKFALDSASEVGTVSIKGVTSVTKTGAGRYAIVLSDAYPTIHSISGFVSGAALDYYAIKILSINLATKTVTIETISAASSMLAADVTEDCDVYVSFLFNNSSV